MKGEPRRSHSIIFILAVFLCISCSTEKKETAKIEMENGVEVIQNPVEPLYRADACTVTEDFTIGVREGDPEYMFQRLYTLAVNDEGDIYVLDYQAKHIKMFDSKGTYLTTIGAPGQGPGELEAPRRMVWTARNGLAVGDLSRISCFDCDGNFIKNIPMKGMGIFTDMDNEGNLLIVDILMEEGVYAVKKVDPQFDLICDLGKSPLMSTIMEKGFRNPFFTLIRTDIINGRQVVTGYAGEGYILKIYDSKGNLVRRIEKEYIPLKITQEDIKERTEGDEPDRNYEYKIPDHFPPFMTLSSDDEGRIWVNTWEKTADRMEIYFDVFDNNGIYTAKVPLKSNPLVIKNNKLYTIEEDEEGYQYVKRYSIKWDLK